MQDRLAKEVELLHMMLPQVMRDDGNYLFDRTGLFPSNPMGEERYCASQPMLDVDYEKRQEMRKRLIKWDFTFIRKVYCRETGASEAEAKDTQAEYLVHMEGIIHRGKGEIRKDQEKLDSFWHTHIVCTKDYASFCAHVFGRFIHHQPTLDDPWDCNATCTNMCGTNG